jgi:hypothetical protein
MKFLCVLFMLVAGQMAGAAPSFAAPVEKAGLVIIVHGSSREVWNDMMRDMAAEVEQKLDRDLFAGSRLAFMEATGPTIAQVVESMEAEGYTRLVAVPVFTVQSEHTLFDVPAILGIYHDEETSHHLEEEGIEIVNARIPILYTSTFSCSNLMQEILMDRVRELSTNPQEEALVLLVHGSDAFAPVWDDISVDIGAQACGQTGISYFDWAQVAVGQRFGTAGLPAIMKAAGHRKRVIVVGSYIALSPRMIIDRYKQTNPGWGVTQLNSIDYVAAEKALFPDPRVTEWILNTAEAAFTARQLRASND